MARADRNVGGVGRERLSSWRLHEYGAWRVMSLCLRLRGFVWFRCLGRAFLYLPIYLSIYLSIDLSIYRSIDLSIHLSIYLSIHLSISIYPSTRLYTITYEY